MDLEGGDNGTWVDLRDLAGDGEFGTFLDQGTGFIAEGVFADDGLLVGAEEEGGGWEPVTADGFGRDGNGVGVGVGALAEADRAGLGAFRQSGWRQVVAGVGEVFGKVLEFFEDA